MKKNLSKVVSSLLITSVLSLTLIGCGNEPSIKETSTVEETQVSETDTGLENAKEAYSLLKSSAKLTDSLGNGIVNTWGYCIDHCNDHDGTITEFAKASGLTTDEAESIYKEYYNYEVSLIGETLAKATSNPGYFLDDFQDVIPRLITYGYATYIETLDDNLATAKSLIQSVDQSESYYSDLIDYYTAISNYLEFCKSPTGNYQSIGTTINDYNNNISTVESKLSFYLE